MKEGIKMAFVETRIVRKFRFEMPDEAAAQLMRIYTEPGIYPTEIGVNPKFDAAFDMVEAAFNRWSDSEDAAYPLCFDENADCVLGADVLHGFEIVPESALDDGTPIV